MENKYPAPVELKDEELGSVSGGIMSSCMLRGFPTAANGSTDKEIKGGTNMVDKKVFELSDDELDGVVGGVSFGSGQWNVGDRVVVSKCDCCGGTDACGKITIVHRPKRGGVIRVGVMMDCCGGSGSYTLGSGLRKI